MRLVAMAAPVRAEAPRKVLRVILKRSPFWLFELLIPLLFAGTHLNSQRLFRTERTQGLTQKQHMHPKTTGTEFAAIRRNLLRPLKKLRRALSVNQILRHP